MNYLSDIETKEFLSVQRQTFVFEDIIGEMYTHYVPSKATLIDGGANVGRHTVPMAEHIGPDGKVFAYEPVPKTAARLRETLEDKGLDNVDLRVAALGDTRTTTTFTWVESLPTRSSIVDPNQLPDGARVSKIDVDVVTLDEEVGAEEGEIAFIKLDLEGGEYHCLVGGRGLIGRSRPIIVLENGRQASAERFGYSKEQFFEFFESVGYTLLDLSGRPFGMDQWQTPGVPYYSVACPSKESCADIQAFLIAKARNAIGQ